jgi:hypothetical protein
MYLRAVDDFREIYQPLRRKKCLAVDFYYYYYNLMGRGICMQFCNYKNYFCNGKPFGPLLTDGFGYFEAV